MATDFNLLKPYKSLLIARFKGKRDIGTLINEILTEISSSLGLEAAKSTAVSRQGRDRLNATTSGDLEIGFLHYTEERIASWTSDPEIKDLVNHLVLVCIRSSHVAILLTDSALKRPLLRRLEGDDTATGLRVLKQIPAGDLNAAFVQGPARTLWLSGTHRRTSVKADSKVLSGISLQDALDPLDDQTFYFSAARCMLQLGSSQARPVGVVPRGSRIWAGTSRDWEDCRHAISLLLDHLAGIAGPKEDPLPVLASASGAEGLEGAFDISFQPPEGLAEAPGANRQQLEEVEQFAYGIQFEILEAVDSDFKANALLNGRKLGTVEIKMNLTRPDHVTWEVTGQRDSDDVAEDHETLLELCKNPEWLKVRYDSGHTLSDGAIFKIRHRDFPFTDFAWVDLTGFEFWEEKPYREEYDADKKKVKKKFVPEEIGHQRSLFCWVQRFWPNLLGTQGNAGGWLACDDGAMEIADFIHLDLAGPKGRPALTLIHVKGAGSEKADRGISVSNYEVVTGQAVKNLRSLDRMILEEGLEGGLGKKISDLVWFNRSKGTREGMLKALSGIGTDYDRRVVVFQPDLSQQAHNGASRKADGKNIARLRQLDTLLLSARASCYALGADFLVVADGSPASPVKGIVKRRPQKSPRKQHTTPATP